MLRSHSVACACFNDLLLPALRFTMIASLELATAELALHEKSAECRSSFSVGFGSVRFYSEDVTHMPVIKDPVLQDVFKDLMAVSWDELPNVVISDVKAALSKNTDDEPGKEVVTNVFRAAEAVEEFGGMLITLKMEFDDSIGLSGEVLKFTYSQGITNFFSCHSPVALGQ